MWLFGTSSILRRLGWRSRSVEYLDLERTWPCRGHARARRSAGDHRSSPAASEAINVVAAAQSTMNSGELPGRRAAGRRQDPTNEDSREDRRIVASNAKLTQPNCLCSLRGPVLTTMRVAVVSGVCGLSGVVHDGILDGNELCRAYLASDADENVAGSTVVAGNVGSMTDVANHSRFSHAEIFAPHLQPAVNTQRIKFVGGNAERSDRCGEAHAYPAFGAIFRPGRRVPVSVRCHSRCAAGRASRSGRVHR